MAPVETRKEVALVLLNNAELWFHDRYSAAMKSQFDADGSGDDVVTQGSDVACEGDVSGDRCYLETIRSDLADSLAGRLRSLRVPTADQTARDLQNGGSRHAGLDACVRQSARTP